MRHTIGHTTSHPRSRVVAAALGMMYLLASIVAVGAERPDFSGVWSLVQHSRPGGAFFIPVEPPLSAKAKAITSAFVTKYDVARFEANANCVEPGMPTIMWGIGSAAMEIVQQPERVTLLSEIANQSRRIYLDGRSFPKDFPNQRVGYSIGHWEGDTLVIETRMVTEWHAPRWPHSDQFQVIERWSLRDPAKIELTGLRGTGPRPVIEGPALVVEMAMSDPEFYVNKVETVTAIFRRQPDGNLFEDNCSEYIWLEALEHDAQQRAAAKAPGK